MMRPEHPIAPGSIIGILGGGQLGRMMASAAGRLGYRCVIFAPDEDCIAADLAHARIDAAYDDQTALHEFANVCDVITIEFENVPAASLELLSKLVPVAPGASILSITQDRLAEKNFVVQSGVKVADFVAIDDAHGLGDALLRHGGGILKTRRMGYDGKGQWRLETDADPHAAMTALAGRPAILEAVVPFEMEISVVTARSWSGATKSFPPVENRHKDGILDLTIAPATLPTSVALAATAIAEKIAANLDLVGLIAVEMFVLSDGELAVNEMAPRPHNSGHWTIDAACVSQFEQVIRAICDLPLGDAMAIRPARMQNLIGADVERWPQLLTDGQARLHLYGKKNIRPGRKMGHVTWVN